MKNQFLGAWTVITAVGGLSFAGVVACAQGLDAGDCKANRTCTEPAAGEGAGAPGAGAQPAAGDATVGGSSQAGEPTLGAGAPSSMGGDAPNAGGSGNGGAAPSMAGAGGAAEMAGAGGAAEMAGAGGVSQPSAPPLTVTSVSPAGNVKNADPEAKIVITFSEPLDAATVVSANIKLFRAGTEVKGDVSVAGGVVTFAPAERLYLLESYKISVSTAVTGVDGAVLSSAYSSSFTTRDGAWKTIDAVKGTIQGLSDSLPISAAGSALLVWNDYAGGGCPVYAEGFQLALSTGLAKALDTTNRDCYRASAGGNALGTAAVLWEVPDSSAGQLTQQFRSGAWQAKYTRVSTSSFVLNEHVAVSPTGMVTVIGFDVETVKSMAWRTDVNGKWVANGDVLASDEALSRASIAFDGAGNGLAVWLAQTPAGILEVLSSRYTTDSGKWSPASKIPDSTVAYAGGPQHVPALAMTSDGTAMAVWIQTLPDGDQVNASIFSPASGWADDSVGLMSQLTGTGTEAPGLTYDGQGFVTAWVGEPVTPGAGVCGSTECVYTTRYDLKSAQWGASLAQQTKAADAAAVKMPRLVSDGRGNALMVWAKPAAANAYTLVYQRLAAGKWSAISALPGGAVTDPAFEVESSLPLSMNASGMAALAWGNRNGLINTIRLASFY